MRDGKLKGRGRADAVKQHGNFGVGSQLVDEPPGELRGKLRLHAVWISRSLRGSAARHRRRLAAPSELWRSRIKRSRWETYLPSTVRQMTFAPAARARSTRSRVVS